MMTQQERDCALLGGVIAFIAVSRNALTSITETIRLVRRMASAFVFEPPVYAQKVGDTMAQSVQLIYAHPETNAAQARFFFEQGCMNPEPTPDATRP